MKALFCTAECQPFSRVGALAEFSCSLVKRLAANGADIAIVTPLYSQINRKNAMLEPIETSQNPEVMIGSDVYPFKAYKSVQLNSTIPVYFIECDQFFGREGIYTNPGDGTGFSDNHKRYTFFQLAIIKLIEFGILSPDLLHLNDHHTSLIPALLQARSDDLRNIKTILTIHNISYQIESDEKLAYQIGLTDDNFFAPSGKYVKHGHLNFLRAGIHYADKIVAVSPTYAKETKEDNVLGHGMAEELQARGDDYLGILNGVDYAFWNPRSDDIIKARYSVDRTGKKLQNKQELLARNGLDYNAIDVPIIGIITRLSDNKGFDLIMEIFDKMMSFNMYFVLLGTGEQKYHKLFESIKMRYPHKFGLNLTYSNKLARQIIAGSDFLLIPNRYEPCGRHQMFAMRYGAVPIVHATGGLADTVKDVSDDMSEGWGFTYNDYNATELLKTIWRAISSYKDRKKFKKIVQRTMKQDFSWKKSAENYYQVYRGLVG